MRAKTTSQTEIDAIVEQLRPLWDDGLIVELRAIGVNDRTNRTDSGYFDNLEDLARHIGILSGHATGVYITMHEVEPALFARAANRVREYGKPTTSDNDITRYRWLLVDFDAVRPADISSTDEEHEAAIARAMEAAEWLAGRGWPRPILADSGNGAHLLYRIDLPVDDTAIHVIKQALQALAMTFDDDRVTVDTGVYNPARIWKAYGSLVCKGDDLEHRPHRTAKILSVPDELEHVDVELVDRLAALVPVPEPAARTGYRGRNDFDLESWIQSHNLDVKTPRTWNGGGKRWVFNACPWNPDHTDNSAYLVQFASGAIAAGCHHNSCQGHTWHDLRELYDGPRTDRRREQDSERITKPKINREDFDPLAYRPEDGGVLDAWTDLYQHKWRYATGRDKWFSWSGTHWQLDEEMDVEEQIETLLDDMNLAAKAAAADTQAEIKGLGKNDPGADALVNEAKRYASLVTATKRTKNRILSVEGMARGRMAAHIKTFDLGNVLNLANGTLNLDTFELYEHRQDDLLTHCLPYAYDEDAQCPKWEQFLREVLVKEDEDGNLVTDDELILLYQELWGYSLTTDTSREVIIFQTGEGGNGKSVSISTLQRLVGDLSVVINFAKLGQQGDYDLSRIPGRRVLFSTESVKGSKIPEDIMKSIASGEALPARAPYETPYQFEPIGKIWWSMNHLPRITDTTLSIWRRMKLIPFNRTIPKHKQDTALAEKLAEELPGILNWALWGLYRLREQGDFTRVEAVDSEVDRYKKSSNPVQLWIEERCIENPGDFATAPGTLYEDYGTWCEDNGFPTHGRDSVNSRQFTQELKRLGHGSKRTNQGYRHPLVLKAKPLSDEPWE